MKSTILDPRNSAFLVFEENPPKKCSFCFGFDSALKTIDAQMFFRSEFLKTRTHKIIDHQKRHFGCFWQLITVFCAFSKNLIKITFVCLLFLIFKHIWKLLKTNTLYSIKEKNLSSTNYMPFSFSHNSPTLHTVQKSRA